MRLSRGVLRLIPDRWRHSVERDLVEEATRSGRHGLARDIWIAWHAARVAATLARRRVSAADAERRRRMTGPGLEVRWALRTLRREPWSTLAIVLTLSLGIGATTAVYAVFNHVSLRPVPGVADPDSLVTIVFQPEDNARSWAFGSADAVELFATANLNFQSIAAWRGSGRDTPVVVHAGEEPRLIAVEQVGPGFLETLGVRARAGRLMTDEEAGNPDAGVALVSEVMWRRDFNGGRDVLGHRLTINGRPVAIVGVVDDYRGWNGIGGATSDVFLPAAASATVGQVIVRPRSAMDISALEARLREVYEPLRQRLTGQVANYVPWAYTGLRQGPVPQTLGVSFGLVLGIAALLLVLACANAASLLLARTVRRRQDLAMRAALGASRGRLIGALTIEAVLLAASAVVGGLALTLGVARLLDGVQVFRTLDALSGIGVDWRVATFASATGVLTVLVFALVPIVSATRVDLRAVLQEASTTVLGGARFRRSLVAVQLALALMLLSGAGVLGRSLWNLRQVDLGLHGEGVYAFTLNPNLLGLRGAARAALRERVIDAFERTPGVTAVGVASPHAFMASRMLAEVRLGPQAEPGRGVETSVVSPGYFETVGLALVAGRDFRPADAAVADDSSVRPGIITAVLSRDLFGSASALGRQVLVGSAFPGGGEWRANRTIEIIGVVADTRTAATLRGPEPARILYEATGQAFVSSRVYVRGAGSVESTRGTVHSVMREVAPGLPLADASTLSDEVDRILVEDRALARLLIIVAGVATLLGFAGVYAVTAYYVSERTREFGVRIALGATGPAIVGQATRTVSVTAAIGAILGLGGYALGARLVQGRLFGITPFDPVTLVGAVGLLGAATLIASWLPARRAARVDPIDALRAE